MVLESIKKKKSKISNSSKDTMKSWGSLKTRGWYLLPMKTKPVCCAHQPREDRWKVEAGPEKQQ
jgi:hypothetical protein